MCIKHKWMVWWIFHKVNTPCNQHPDQETGYHQDARNSLIHHFSYFSSSFLFFEIQFTNHSMYPFKIYSLMNSSKFIQCGGGGFPGGASGKEPACQRRRHRRRRFDPWVGQIPWRRAWQPTPVFLPGDSHRGAWQATVHKVPKSQTRLSDLARIHIWILGLPWAWNHDVGADCKLNSSVQTQVLKEDGMCAVSHVESL